MVQQGCPVITSSYALGLFFLVIVCILWTTCSMVVQYLHKDMKFDSSFLIVYIGTSLFSIFIPLHFFCERWCIWWKNMQHFCRRHLWRKRSCRNGGIVISSRRQYLQPLPPEKSFENIESDTSTLVPSYATQDDIADNFNFHTSNDDYSDEPSANVLDLELSASALLFSDKTYQSSTSKTVQSEVTPLGNNINITIHPSHRDHIYMASKVAPLWFVSNYFYALSLEWTSIASSTVLASMGSIFSFMFATCSKFGDETVTKWKMLGVILCFMGGVATTWTDLDGKNGISPDTNMNKLRILQHTALHQVFDVHDPSVKSLLGDLAGILSAIGYGAYTVLIRHLFSKDEQQKSVQLFFGYVGLLNMTILLPFAIWVMVSFNHNSSSIESQPESDDTAVTAESNLITYAETNTMNATLTVPIFLFLIGKGLLDNVLSDYLWAKAVILTSATVASVGVGLTIPMAFVADIILGNSIDGEKDRIIGAILVLTGFIFVNIDGLKEKSSAEESQNEETGDSNIQSLAIIRGSSFENL